MRISVRSLTISRFIGTVLTILSCGPGPAWAGGGGEDAAGDFLNPLCNFLGMTCPTLPTATQIVLELSALGNRPPDLVRGPPMFTSTTTGEPQPSGGQFGNCTVAGISPSIPCSSFAVNAVNPAIAATPTTPTNPATAMLENLTPLAFISQKPSATPTQLGNASANSFFYAVANKESGLSDTLNLFYDYPPQKNQTFAKGQAVANISLPFGVIQGTGNTAAERFVPATLQIIGKGACGSADSGCLTANIVGNFSGMGAQTYPAADFGVNVTFLFGKSPLSPQAHATLKVEVPLLVTQATDPAYFGVNASGSATLVNQFSGLPTAFDAKADTGFPSAFGLAGIVPYASPQTVPNAKKNTLPNFSSCASISTGASGGGTVPAVAAFFAIGTEGTTYASAPMTTVATCPF
jgi:hypothetical protein